MRVASSKEQKQTKRKTLDYTAVWARPLLPFNLKKFKRI